LASFVRWLTSSTMAVWWVMMTVSSTRSTRVKTLSFPGRCRWHLWRHLLLEGDVEHLRWGSALLVVCFCGFLNPKSERRRREVLFRGSSVWWLVSTSQFNRAELARFIADRVELFELSRAVRVDVPIQPTVSFQLSCA
jgi:hypothetical protein